jgi:hypothetical protein
MISGEHDSAVSHYSSMNKAGQMYPVSFRPSSVIVRLSVIDQKIQTIYQPIHAAFPAGYPYRHEPGAATAPSVYPHPGGLPFLSSQVSGVMPIDPRLLQIDAHQRAARGFARFTPRTMGLPFAPLVVSGPQTVVPAGVPAPGASTTAAVKRKRAYVPRKTAALTICQPAPAAPKRKRKAKIHQPCLPTPVSATIIEPTTEGTTPINAVRVAVPAAKRRKHASSTSTNAQLSTADPVSASSMFNSWTSFVPLPASNDQAADNASGAAASGAAP